MLPLKYLIDQYSSIIKRGLAGILFLVMILMIRTIINYQVIIDTTDAVKRKTTSVQTAMEYSQNFQAKYLASDYGHFFLAHDNNTLFPGERIISFKTWTGTTESPTIASFSHIPDRREVEEQEKIQLPPQDSRKIFIQEKLQW